MPIRLRRLTPQLSKYKALAERIAVSKDDGDLVEDCTLLPVPALTPRLPQRARERLTKPTLPQASGVRCFLVLRPQEVGVSHVRKRASRCSADHDTVAKRAVQSGPSLDPIYRCRNQACVRPPS